MSPDTAEDDSMTMLRLLLDHQEVLARQMVELGKGHDTTTRQHDALLRDLPMLMRGAVQAGIHDALGDKEMVRAFWDSGYLQLSNAAGDNASKWIGRRILTVAIAAVFTASLIWLVKTGAFGPLK